MTLKKISFLFSVPLIAVVAVIRAAPPDSPEAASKVVFSRDVLPLLNKECRSCHVGPAAPGGYSIENAAKLLKGGRHGAAVVPGKSGDSTLIKYLLGEMKPQMPPGKPLAMNTISVIRKWIDEGGKIDSMKESKEKSSPKSGAAGSISSRGEKLSSQKKQPVGVEQVAPVTALAFSPDGSWIAAGGYRSVRLIDPKSGVVKRTLNGPVDQVLAVAWASDGKSLAAAGGTAGVSGEVCIWDTATWGTPKVYVEHADTISGIAWKPGSSEFATSSLDKTVKVWDAGTGKVVKTLKDHADPVNAVAYSGDGKWLASGSSDRSAKVYSTGTYERPIQVYRHNDAVLALAFPENDLLVTACADKTARSWPVTSEAVENPLNQQGDNDSINAVATSSAGDVLVWGNSGKRVKVWNREMSAHRQDSPEVGDWVYSVGVSPDGRVIAAGAGDGKVYLWTEGEGKVLGPGAKPFVIETRGEKRRAR